MTTNTTTSLMPLSMYITQRDALKADLQVCEAAIENYGNQLAEGLPSGLWYSVGYKKAERFSWDDVLKFYENPGLLKLEYPKQDEAWYIGVEDCIQAYEDSIKKYLRNRNVPLEVEPFS